MCGWRPATNATLRSFADSMLSVADLPQPPAIVGRSGNRRAAPGIYGVVHSKQYLRPPHFSLGSIETTMCLAPRRISEMTARWFCGTSKRKQPAFVLISRSFANDGDLDKGTCPVTKMGTPLAPRLNCKTGTLLRDLTANDSCHGLVEHSKRFEKG